MSNIDKLNQRDATIMLKNKMENAIQNKKFMMLTDADSQKIVGGQGKKTTVIFEDQETAVNNFDAGIVDNCVSEGDGRYVCEIPVNPPVGVDRAELLKSPSFISNAAYVSVRNQYI